MSLEQHLPAEDAVLPSLITYRAKESADKTFAVFPSEKGDSRHVSFAEFAQACSRFGRAIAPDGPAKEGHVVGIIANVDSLLYLAAIGGLTFAGLTVCSLCSRHERQRLTSRCRRTPSPRVLRLSPLRTCSRA
jgi:acyl-CoA synthetase (AMP-forming)/AMP-acid ligase II